MIQYNDYTNKNMYTIPTQFPILNDNHNLIREVYYIGMILSSTSKRIF